MVTIILLVIVLIVSTIVFLRTDGRFDKRTLTYVAIFSLLSLAFSAGIWLLYTKVQLAIFEIFILTLTICVMVGMIHLTTMFSLIWAKRDSYVSKRDSLIEETSFTTGLSSFVVLLLLVPFGYLIGKLEVAMSMYGLTLAFILPFVIAKSFDFLAQVPEKEFDKKWVYETYPFDEAQWPREQMVNVGFIVSDSLKNENKWFRKKARFTILIPRQQPLCLIFRLALRQYHKNNPSVPVQELGYEDNVQPFWWLFSVKFNILKPNTWRHHPEYLDPNESLAYNNVENGHFISAVRMVMDKS